MKIGMVGAGGTGKTTLALELARVIGHQYIGSPSRACFEKHRVKTEDDQKNLTPNQRLALQLDIFQAIDDAVMQHSSGVFDRTHLDNLGYGLLQCRESLKNNEYERMKDRTYMGLKTFDLILYAPIYNWTLPSDGMRTQNLGSRELHDAYVRCFLDDYDVDYYVLANEDVQERLVHVQEMITQAAFRQERRMAIQEIPDVPA